MSRVVCSPELQFDHRAAARRLAYDQDFARCEELALLLPEQLKGQVHFTRMDYLRLAYPRVSGPDDRVELVTDSAGDGAGQGDGRVHGGGHQRAGRPPARAAPRGTALTEHFVARKHLPYVQFTAPPPPARLRGALRDQEPPPRRPQRPPVPVGSRRAARPRPCSATRRPSGSTGPPSAPRASGGPQQINVKFRFLQYIHQRLQEVDQVRLRLCPHRPASTSASLFVDGIDEHRTHFLYHVYRPEGGIRPRGIRLRRMFDRRDKQEEDDGNGAGADTDRCLEVDITRCHLSDNPYHNQTLPEVDAMFDSGIKKPTRSQSAP